MKVRPVMTKARREEIAARRAHNRAIIITMIASATLIICEAIRHA